MRLTKLIADLLAVESDIGDIEVCFSDPDEGARVIGRVVVELGAFEAGAPTCLLTGVRS